MNRANTPQLEAFLREVGAKLGDMPPTRRLEVLNETREHLQSLIAARLADGFDEENAWRKALADFGAAEDIGSALAAEWHRAPRYETEGSPIPKAEQTKKILLTVVGMGVFYSAMLWAIPWLTKRHIAGFALLALLPFTFGIGWWRWRRNGGRYTPATAASQVVSVTFPVLASLYLQFQPKLHGTRIELGSIFLFDGVLIALCLGLSLWQKREAKALHPWKNSPQYKTNPIAAEEQYRSGPLLGLVAGTTMGCLGSLWMGWQFLGWEFALAMCAVQVLFAFVYYRIIRI